MTLGLSCFAGWIVSLFPLNGSGAGCRSRLVDAHSDGISNFQNQVARIQTCIEKGHPPHVGDGPPKPSVPELQNANRNPSCSVRGAYAMLVFCDGCP